MRACVCVCVCVFKCDKHALVVSMLRAEFVHFCLRLKSYGVTSSKHPLDLPFDKSKDTTHDVLGLKPACK